MLSRRAVSIAKNGLLKNSIQIKAILRTTSKNTIPVRAFSRIVDFEDDIASWPKAKSNTFLNVCPQSTKMIVERLGKLHKIQEAGWFVAIPFIDDIRFVIDMREKALSISPQSAITKDNVHVDVSGNLYCQFVNAEKAAYGSKNPIYSIKQIAQSTMRSAIGELELDEILHARAHLNSVIRGAVQESAETWGLEVKRYEITDITPDRFISEAMDQQAAAERDRRKKVLEAEGDKRSAELQSEGVKIRMKNESEGTLILVTNEAEAKKIQMIKLAEGEIISIRTKALAQAEAIKIISDALAAGNFASDAAKLAIAKDYITMYGEIGQKSNTMIFSDYPANVNALMAQVNAVVKALPESTKS